MGPFKRILTALTVLVLVAAACSDDTVDQATVNSVVDDITPEPTDPPEDPPEETEDPPEGAEPEPEPEPEPEADPDPVVTEACLVLRHYSSGLFASPYEAFITFDFDGPDPVEVTVEHAEEYTVDFFPGGDDSLPGITVTWPVFAPGPVPLPTSIAVDGVETIDMLVTDHFDGMREFVAASSEVRDEEIVPRPCPIGFMVIPEGFDS